VLGGSAGGLTVLLLCALHADLLRAGVSLFGVTDLFELASTTHRFESRYLDRLVGVLPQEAARYHDRSPLTHAPDIAVPLLVLQGADDKVVPPAQAELLVSAMRNAGRTVEYQLYEGEGHGWRRLDTIVDDLRRTEAFLRKHVLELA
jgi:dipeptidyl aminopeptidase/acylaminoacyl peptidase